jgi:hypothetical protein
MGGVGSGTWCRWGKQETTESCKRIDIRYMKRRGLLVPGTSNSLSWTCGGEPNGSIRYRYSGGCLLLDFKFRDNGGEWEPVEQIVPLTSTPCNYGNERHWFHCPRCHYRCAILYMGGSHFLCRKCYKLPYNSQMQSDLDRMAAQLNGLGERIFEHNEYGEGWLKKKGMHQKTFERLFSRYENLEFGLDQVTMARFGLKLSSM